MVGFTQECSDILRRSLRVVGKPGQENQLRVLPYNDEETLTAGGREEPCITDCGVDNERFRLHATINRCFQVARAFRAQSPLHSNRRRPAFPTQMCRKWVISSKKLSEVCVRLKAPSLIGQGTGGVTLMVAEKKVKLPQVQSDRL